MCFRENVGKKFGNGKLKDKMTDSDSLQPLLFCGSTVNIGLSVTLINLIFQPSCSSDSYRGSYTPPLGKLLEGNE